jgi:hypothetical protein
MLFFLSTRYNEGISVGLALVVFESLNTFHAVVIPYSYCSTCVFTRVLRLLSTCRVLSRSGACTCTILAKAEDSSSSRVKQFLGRDMQLQHYLFLPDVVPSRRIDECIYRG